MATDSTPLIERLHALAKYERVFSEPGFTFGRWEQSWEKDGVLHLGWYEPSEGALAFTRDAAAFGWVVHIDWMTWAGTPEARYLMADPAHVAEAGVDELEKLLTLIIRGDRFSEGTLAGAYESGMLLALTRRAGRLAAEAEQAQADGKRPPAS